MKILSSKTNRQIWQIQSPFPSSSHKTGLIRWLAIISVCPCYRLLDNSYRIISAWAKSESETRVFARSLRRNNNIVVHSVCECVCVLLFCRATRIEYFICFCTNAECTEIISCVVFISIIYWKINGDERVKHDTNKVNTLKIQISHLQQLNSTLKNLFAHSLRGVTFGHHYSDTPYIPHKHPQSQAKTCYYRKDLEKTRVQVDDGNINHIFELMIV